MKRVILYLSLCAYTLLMQAEYVSPDHFDEVIGGLHYMLYDGPGEATVRACDMYDCETTEKWPYLTKNIFNHKNKYSGDIVIPSEIVFEGKVYRVTGIDRQAFQNCSGVTSIKLPTSLKAIREYAFLGCYNLTSITIPRNVEDIEGGIFAGCSRLTNVIVEEGNPKYDSRENCNAIIETRTDKICAACDAATIPVSIKSIGREAFAGLNITTLEFRNLVTIGYDAFFCCKRLKELNFPNGIDTLNSHAFYGCKQLTTLKVSKKYPVIFDDKYALCTAFSWGGDPPILNTFQFQVLFRVGCEIRKWQQREKFETTVQYQTRVTKENQERKTQELMEEAIKEYTKNKLKVSLGEYDADHEYYTLNSNYGKTFLKISLSEAPAFEENFKNATFDASYIATEDGLQIKDLNVTLNGKTYHAEQTATELAATTIDIDLPEVEIPLASNPQGGVAQQPTPKPVTIDKTIDQNIPTGTGQNTKTFAVIIGNERYTQVAQVPYAQNDAKIFAEYCKQTLGLPEKNVRQYNNATFGTMLSAVNDIKDIAEAYKGDCNVIFYYAGHGVPNETSKDAYLLPVDADGRQTEACYPVSRLYKELGDMGARNVVVFMDACFSGAQRGEGMLASARGVALKAKADAPQGNMVVFTAATGDETAFPYKEKGHGMFTYFLLKKLQETKGDCTLGELGEYIQTNVRQQSVVENRKSQTPTVVPSAIMAESWKSMKLK